MRISLFPVTFVCFRAWNWPQHFVHGGYSATPAALGYGVVSSLSSSGGLELACGVHFALKLC